MVIIIIFFKILSDVVSLRILYQIMETILIGIISFVLGSLICAFVLHRRTKKDIAKYENLLSEQVAQKDSAVERSFLLDGELKASKEKVLLLEENIARLMEERKDEAIRSQKDFDEKVDKLTLLFKEQANEILKQRSKDLSEQSQQSLKSVLEPLNQKMDQFRKAVEDSKEKSLSNATRVEEQIKAMISHTELIKDQAHNLATALRSNNKIQGNWGELVLGNILESMGLRQGQDYFMQQTLVASDGTPLKSEETGRRMIPDAILYLPENRVIAIDSKVSLEAYTNYVNEEDPNRKGEYLQAHCRSVESHIKELAAKEYGRYLNKGSRNSLEYVLMFIPNEGAFQLFYKSFPQKWHEAFDKGVIIAGESNLFAMLKIIETTWTQIKQQRNTEQVMELASQLLDRVGRFVGVFNEVGKEIDRVQRKFEDARGTLMGQGRGRQSILMTAKNMERKGVVVKSKFLADIEQDDDSGQLLIEQTVGQEEVVEHKPE